MIWLVAFFFFLYLLSHAALFNDCDDLWCTFLLCRWSLFFLCNNQVESGRYAGLEGRRRKIKKTIQVFWHVIRRRNLAVTGKIHGKKNTKGTERKTKLDELNSWCKRKATDLTKSTSERMYNVEKHDLQLLPARNVNTEQKASGGGKKCPNAFYLSSLVRSKTRAKTTKISISQVLTTSCLFVRRRSVFYLFVRGGFLGSVKILTHARHCVSLPAIDLLLWYEVCIDYSMHQ